MRLDKYLSSPVSVLLTGKKGLYMDEEAMAYAKGVLSCRSLESCPDFFCLSLAEGESSIGVEEIGRVLSFSSMKSVTCAYKVIYVPDMDLITVQAQNMLLKCLEDSTSTIFIGISYSDGRKVLPTVKSRMRMVAFKPFREDYFVNKFGNDGKDLYYATAGCPGLCDEVLPHLARLRAAKSAFEKSDLSDFLIAVGEMKEKDANSFAQDKALIGYLLNYLEASAVNHPNALEVMDIIHSERGWYLRPSYNKAMFFSFAVALMMV